MVTLKDIAKATGLNFRSVSQVLNGNDPRYNVETQRRVRETALKMGYRPNAVARSMVNGKTRSIGVVGMFTSAAINLDRLDGISRELHRIGYKMFFAARNPENPSEDKENIEDLLERRVEGLMLGIDPDSDITYYESLRARGVPIVLLGHYFRPHRFSMVMVDTNAGTFDATRHLIDLGHKNIACLIGAQGTKAPELRWGGFKRALAKTGIEPRRKWVLSDQPATRESVRDFTKKILSETPRPTAILYLNDEMAFVGLHTILAMRLRVPEDVSIIGFDDVPLSQLTWPELTTVRQPREELARAALPLLMRQIKGETNRPEIVSLKPQLIIRQSSAPAPKLSKLRRERKRA